MSELCLTISAPAALEEKLLDVFLELEERFDTAPAFTHGNSHAAMRGDERVRGRTGSVQVTLLLAQAQVEPILSRLREDFRGTGLRYWAVPLAVQGEIE